MNPLFFGERTRRLFGVHQEAEGGARRARAAVLCQPWGSEYLFTHRAVRQLSAMLNVAGFHTLRFDYWGTGDSGGDLVDADPAGWRADIETAIDELASTTGVRRVTLIGLRLGALLAADVAVAQPSLIDKLVLWDPVVSGAAYPREMQQLCEVNALRHKPPGNRRPQRRADEAGGGYEMNGFAMTAAFIAALGQAHLADMAAHLPDTTYLIASSDAETFDAARAALASRPDILAAARLLPARPIWVEDWPFTRGDVPVAVLQSIVAWLG